MSILSLKDRAKQFSIVLPFMEGRDKGEMEGLHGNPVTIIEYGFMKDDKDGEYVCFVVAEDEKRFYFGGQVLTDQMRQLDEEGYREAILADGLPVLFGSKVGKNKRAYTTVEFYPAG